MFGFLLSERVAVDGVVGVDEFVRRERCAAFLALVAVGAEAVATRAFTADVAVGEELVGLGVVELFGCLFDELAVVVEATEVV